ncbi:MAG: 3-deoxy-manno-octulosonate cytidylyltransferase, partial [Gammaproteobacteria bacterium]|nr:3-deoxy-manno-octulosonate cytidylyltransferase [Gammaproteobacteria bacterium]
MQRIVIIPARYASTRLPGKPLLDICGKPMLLHVYEQAKKSSMDRVIIATDDKRIYQTMDELGCEVYMTSDTHQSGTDRLAEILNIIGAGEDDIIVNVQGDEPLMPPEVIDQVANLLTKNPDAPMATLCTAITDKQSLENPNVVKVVSNSKGEAVYFSRAKIPFKRDKMEISETDTHYQRHIGLYAY